MSVVRIHVNSPAVPDWNEIDAVEIGYRELLPASQWAWGVAGFSSQGSASQYSAQQVLGLPDVYPNYGDLPPAWSSRFADPGPEFLDLYFAQPSPINFVNVVETYKPGALYKVSVKNPDTGLWELVWSRAAAPAPELSRVLSVSFPEPRFLVSGVLLEFDSPAVPGCNEIDAVGIGRCACQASLLDALVPSGVRSRDAIEATRPNPFQASTGLAFSLSREARVKVDVFNVLGQYVASVLDGTLTPGRHDVRWNGRDAGGRPAANGIYYLRIASPTLSGSRKILKVQ